MSNFLKLLISIVICEAAGLVGTIFTSSAIPGWYATLTRPELAPSNGVFGPVWTTLYALMGIAAYLVWKEGSGMTDIKGRRDVRVALFAFGVQLVLNTFWSIIFFGLRSPGLALVEIALMWVAILATIVLFSRISKGAAWLLIPYILWVSFAAYLNYAIWVLN